MRAFFARVVQDRRLAAIALLGVLSGCRWGFDGMIPADATPAVEWRVVAIRNGTGLGLAAAIDSSGTLWSWGNRREMHRLTSFSDWTSVTAGLGHACALRSSGELWCWGGNSAGELGIGMASGTEILEPQLVAFQWTEVRAAWSSTCGIRADSTLWCWGSAISGVLGTGGTAYYEVSPVQVGAATGWHELAMGDSAGCALDGDGNAWCWGDNRGNVLGTGPAPQQLVPALSAHAVGWQSFSLGLRHLCAIDNANQLWCVGTGTSGQLGDGQRIDRATPVMVPGRWRSVAVGAEHTCAIDTSDRSYCWGSNRYGELGTSSAAIVVEPVASLDGVRVDALAVSGNATGWLTSDGRIALAGSGAAGLHGAGPIDSGEPTPVQARRWTQVSVATSHTCGIDTDGRTACWGLNANGELGDNTGIHRATPVDLPMTFRAVAAWEDYTIAIATDDSMWGWGNVPGFGPGLPRQLHPGPWASVAAGFSICAVTLAGQVFCIGNNSWGQLGDGTRVNRSVFTPLAGPAGSRQWRHVTTHYLHTCALDMTDQIWCWGANSSGELGRGSQSSFLPRLCAGERRSRSRRPAFLLGRWQPGPLRRRPCMERNT